MAAPPYMKLYVGDYHGDTTHLSTVEHGAYLLLLMALWRAGGRLPRDDRRLAALAKLTPDAWAEIKPTIMEFFTIKGGSITHGRIVKEMAKYDAVVEKRSVAGKASAAKKASAINGEASTSVENLDNTCSHNQEPEPEPEPVEKEIGAVAPKHNRGTRLPSDWTPSDADLTFALSQNMTTQETQHEADKFRDFWLGKAGRDGIKLDWPATWRNWCRNRRGGGASPAGRPNASRDRPQTRSMAGIIARNRGEASGADDVPAGRWLLPED